MTKEDYMNSYEWDHEIEMIIQDMRDRLHDLKDKYYSIHSDGSIVVKDHNE